MEDKEKRQARLRSYVRYLKNNNLDMLGDILEIAINIDNSISNFVDANPLAQACRFFTKKEFIENALIKLKLGDHIAVDRFSHYTHHGIYGGNGKIMEYDNNMIKESSIEDFMDGDFMLYTIDSEAIYPPKEIWERACYRRGECNYNLLWNNCEHFARWCRNGAAIKKDTWVETSVREIQKSEVPTYILKKLTNDTWIEVSAREVPESEIPPYLLKKL